MSLIVEAAFLRRAYDEALALLVETRNYVAYQEARETASLDNAARLLASQETMRMTSRMTQIMAWLMCRRAVENGELAPEEALSSRYEIDGRAVCLDDRFGDDTRLPPALRGLLERTLLLYRRIDRLDRQLRDAAG